MSKSKNSSESFSPDKSALQLVQQQSTEDSLGEVELGADYEVNSPSTKNLEIKSESVNTFNSKRLQGITFSIMAMTLFVSGSGLIKVLYTHNKQIREYEVVYWKSITMVPMNYMYARYHGVFITDVPAKYRNFIALRALVGFFGVGGQYACLEFLPVSLMNTLTSLTTIFTTVISHVFLKEYMTRYDICSFVFCFLGVLVINIPAFYNDEQDSTSKERSTSDYVIGTLVALSSALGGGIVQTLMRYMNQGIHYCISPFWFASGCSFMSPIFYTLTHKLYWHGSPRLNEVEMPTQYDAYTIVLLLAVSVMTFLGQVFTSRSFQLEKASIIATFNYTTVLGGFIIDIFYFKVSLQWTDYLGSFMIVGVLVGIALLKAMGYLK